MSALGQKRTLFTAFSPPASMSAKCQKRTSKLWHGVPRCRPSIKGMDLVNSPTTPTNFFRLFANYVGVKLDAAVYAFLKHALHLVIEPRKSVERLLKGQEVVEHRFRLVVPTLAGHDDADTRRINQRKRRGDAPA